MQFEIRTGTWIFLWGYVCKLCAFNTICRTDLAGTNFVWNRFLDCHCLDNCISCIDHSCFVQVIKGYLDEYIFSPRSNFSYQTANEMRLLL